MVMTTQIEYSVPIPQRQQQNKCYSLGALLGLLHSAVFHLSLPLCQPDMTFHSMQHT